jgi:3-hydroxyisobutyrate dehydrogenase-like beta-hydroxyacid dehydrogenase
VVDLSTIAPEQSREFARRLRRRGIGYLDAPVLGSTEAAERRGLVLVVGGEAGDLDRARPVLERLGRRVEHVGPVGAGTSFKLVNNLLFLSHMAAAGEALALGKALGLERRQLLGLLVDDGASSRVLEMKKGFIAESSYPAQFPLALAHKDLVLALAAARRRGLRLTVSSQVRKWYDVAMGEGRAREDYSSVVESEIGRLSGRRDPTPSVK